MLYDPSLFTTINKCLIIMQAYVYLYNNGCFNTSHKDEHSQAQGQAEVDVNIKKHSFL